MSEQEEAKIILEALDMYAPANINWNHEKQWISAIVKGLREVKIKKEDKQ